MRLEQLKYFVILSQEGSFNKAAAKAHITQPALTANIKSMEKELNKFLEVSCLIMSCQGLSRFLIVFVFILFH